METTLLFILISILISITTWTLVKLNDLQKKFTPREEVTQIYRIIDNNRDVLSNDIQKMIQLIHDTNKDIQTSCVQEDQNIRNELVWGFKETKNEMQNTFNTIHNRIDYLEIDLRSKRKK